MSTFLEKTSKFRLVSSFLHKCKNKFMKQLETFQEWKYQEENFKRQKEIKKKH